ncbi:MAG TPA: FG-GAP-like repeat-containing protein [bacterium]
MKNNTKLVNILFLCFIPLTVHALSYVESSQGLSTPQMEAGRTELEMADINADGNIDILSIGDHGSPYVNTQEHGVMVWFGNGLGSWSVYQNGEFGYGGIAIGDINNDGFMDIGYGMHHNYSGVDFGDSVIEAALGDGTGQNWTPWDDGISIGDPNAWGMFCTDFADIDNDGDLDLGGNAFGADDGNHIFINHLDGTWHQCFGFLGGNSSMDFLFCDVNADGYADYCAGHQYGSVYLGNGSGGFTLADGNLPPGGTSGRRGPSIGDVDNDGDQDFAFRNASGGVEVWQWLGGNTWANFSGTLPTSGPYYNTQLCDMNIDGFMDLSAFGDSVVSVWLGNGSGNWTLDTTFKTTYPGYMAAFRVAADADHNGYPDIALVSREGTGMNPVNRLRFYKESSVPESLFIFPVFPRGGEKLYRNSVHFINWTCGVPAGNTASVRLELSTNGSAGPWTQIVASVPNNGRYQWLIPAGSPTSTNCYIRYTATTSSDTAIAVTHMNFTILPLVAVDEQKAQPLAQISELNVYPTQFSDRVWMDISTYGYGNTKIAIYDAAGRVVKNLFKIKGTGQFKIYWDRTDDQGKKAPSGVYIVSLESTDKRLNKKIIAIK